MRAILDATAQILEAGGIAALTTNAVAARAGVSIGTLYQYFADKDALLVALARREIDVTIAQVAHALQRADTPSPEDRVRAIVRALIHAFGGRRRARRALLHALFGLGVGPELMLPVLEFAGRLGSGGAAGTPLPTLTREAVFVLTRATMSTIRSAVLEDQPFLASRAFEDELVRLNLAYLAALGIDLSGARPARA